MDVLRELIYEDDLKGIVTHYMFCEDPLQRKHIETHLKSLDLLKSHTKMVDYLLFMHHICMYSGDSLPTLLNMFKTMHWGHYGVTSYQGEGLRLDLIPDDERWWEILVIATPSSVHLKFLEPQLYIGGEWRLDEKRIISYTEKILNSYTDMRDMEIMGDDPDYVRETIRSYTDRKRRSIASGERKYLSRLGFDV